MRTRIFEHAPVAVLACAFVTSMCTGSNDDRKSNPGIEGGAGAAGAGATGSSGGPGSSACKTLADCTPPPSGCADWSHLEYFVPAACVNQQCVFETKLQSCPCVNNGCNVNSTAAGTGPLDPCTTADDCVPPVSQCVDASTLVYYEPACEIGNCVYAQKTLSCSCQTAGCVVNSTAGGAGPLEAGGDGEPEAGPDGN
jgi:hypothetical protein